MPDLSNLLGAVYGDGPSKPSRDAEDEAHVEHEPAAEERTPAVPDWADDEHLDAAFAEWKPGPSADASPTEHAFVMDADDDSAPPLADDLAAALSEALVAASGSADDTDLAPDPQLGQPATRFDFSAFDEEPDEPVAEDTDNAPDLSKSEIQPLEQAQTEQAHDLGEVEEPELVHEPEPELVHVPEPEAPAHVPEPKPEPELVHEPEPVLVHEPEPEPSPFAPPSMTSQRAAAAELTAASRVDPQPVVETPAAPEPAPAPVASIPVPTAPAPMPAAVPAMSDGGEAPTTMMPGTRRWDRSDDDILPDKPAGKKFFSFSLRRG